MQPTPSEASEGLTRIGGIIRATITGLDADDLPQSPIALGILLAKVLSPNDLDILDQLEKDHGEKEANRWLCGVLAATERYEDEGGVFVTPLI